MANTDITAHRLRDLLKYDPDTGIWTWNNVGPPRNAKPGDPAGGLGAKGHWTIKVDGVTYKAHRLAWFYVTGSWPKDQIDHINRVADDNRFTNLREASNAINCQNQGIRSNNKSGFQGVFRFHKKWGAHINVNMKSIHLGTFDTAKEAGAAYMAAKKCLHPGSPAIHLNTLINQHVKC